MNITELDDFDFGFTTVSDDVFAQAEAATQEGQLKADRIYKMVLPLLNNLAKDADKNAYIHWPNRAAKIEEFKKKLQSIINS
jgi:hypothetical protein